VDEAVSYMSVAANQIVNATNANSSLTANQTEITNGATPLNMNT
jgi:hypothetical protein